jgi:hypothetical protein
MHVRECLPGTFALLLLGGLVHPFSQAQEPGSMMLVGHMSAADHALEGQFDLHSG